MKENSFLKVVVALIFGLVLGVGSYYLIDKYVLEKEYDTYKVVNNENETKKDETAKSYSLEELNAKINDRSYYLRSIKNASLASKYGITRKMTINQDNSIDVYFESKNGKKLQPVSHDELFAASLSHNELLAKMSQMVDNYYIDYFLSTMEYNISIDEIEDINNKNEYLVMAVGSNHVYIYDNKLNLLGNFTTTQGGLYYPNDISKVILKYRDKIEVHNNYILSLEALDDNNTKFAIVKYTVDNGKLNRTIDYTFADGEVECAQCK